MATIILSCGDKIHVSESYLKVADMIRVKSGDYIELKMISIISPANIEKDDFSIEEPTTFNKRHIAQIF